MKRRLVWLLLAALPAGAAEWRKESGVRVSAGNVPFVYPLETGGYRLYFCGQGGILSAYSANGLDFQIEPGVRVPRGCDPSLVRLDDGRYRMYYKIPFGPGGPGQSVHKAYSAISADGVQFTDEGLRLESEGTIDRGWVSVPEVIRTFDGRWRMYYVSARDGIANVIASAVSDDGLLFEREEGIRAEGLVDPAVVKLPNGQYWLFGMAGLGSPGSTMTIRSATSADGLRFYWDEGVRIRAGGPDDARGLFDPSVVALPDGRYRMYYGGDAGKTLSAVGEREPNPQVGAAAVWPAALAPGGIGSLYGEDLRAGAAVQVNGQPAAVLHASSGQINFAVPETVAGPAAHIVVTAAGDRPVTALAELRRVSPYLFTLDASGKGEAAALDAVRFTPGPFAPGGYVALFGSGLRRARQVTARLGEAPLEVLYFGPQGSFPGLDQVNARIPPDFAGRGALPLRLRADDQEAPEVTLTVRAP
jgi:uncharacterized protein (TIGR03437 family)